MKPRKPTKQRVTIELSEKQADLLLVMVDYYCAGIAHSEIYGKTPEELSKKKCAYADVTKSAEVLTSKVYAEQERIARVYETNEKLRTMLAGIKRIR